MGNWSITSRLEGFWIGARKYVERALWQADGSEVATVSTSKELEVRYEAQKRESPLVSFGSPAPGACSSRSGESCPLRS
jgi:hypothetical protein